MTVQQESDQHSVQEFIDTRWRKVIKENRMTSSAPTNHLHSFPLMRKKVPAATPSRPTVRPSPQNTAGPTPGRVFSTSGDRNTQGETLTHLHIWRQKHTGRDVNTPPHLETETHRERC